jgi:tRNA(fMet)-specific endonuclease VapC
MSFSHLLDTNVISRLLKEPQGVSARRLAEVGDHRVCTSVVVAGELRFGAALRGSERLTLAVERVLGAIPVLPLEPPSDEHYANIRKELQSRGTPIGPNDLLIAAHARSLGLVLVTENDAEFRRVNQLSVENWEA